MQVTETMSCTYRGGTHTGHRNHVLYIEVVLTQVTETMSCIYRGGTHAGHRDHVLYI